MANDPSQNIKLYGRLYREADGITPDRAMVDAALVNISQGTGSVIDAAKVLRIDPEALRKRLPPRSNSSASPVILCACPMKRSASSSMTLLAKYAAIVGRLVEDQNKHTAILRVLADTDPSNLTQAEAIVRQAMDTEFTVATQDTLFGEEMLVESLFKERARVLDETIKILRKDRAVFNSLVQNEKRIEAGGNTLQTDQTQQRREQMAKRSKRSKSRRTGKAPSPTPLPKQRNVSKKQAEPPQPLETSPMMSEEELNVAISTAFQNAERSSMLNLHRKLIQSQRAMLKG